MAQIKRYHEIPGALHIGCQDPAAYFIPFESEEKSALPRSESAYFTSLCGNWEFGFFENAGRLDIESPDFPACEKTTDEITVPGNWQLYSGRGYDVPNYINQDYPYPVDPPHIPDVIPCGLYRKKTTFTKNADKAYYINFEGVASCFYLWVNGRFAAYSQVSHSTSVIDITGHLTDGENTFEVLVVKHCDGSYYEDQDFFRLSGIFREVYITERDAKHIEDIDIFSQVSEELDSVHITAEIKGTDSFGYKLLSPDGKILAEGKDNIDITLDNPPLWNPENPVLCNLYIDSGSEFICQPLGFKRFEIKDSVVYLNGKKVKAKGINRHDSRAETGYWVPEEQMIQELYSLKRANVNTIRTSHYPNDPRFVGLCDKLGFMVVDEADLECHGMGYNFGDWYWDYWAHLCDAPEYREACVDRAKLLYERDKNHVCVIMWSLGNESGCGENHRAMAQYIRSRRSDAVIHYENAHLEYQARLGKDFTDISDVESRMYASIDYLKEYLADDSLKKPFFYCEYVDSMSTGEIQKHWDGLEDEDKYFGGCVWEYCDHAVNIGTKENPKYRYGGDFGDWPNDNICCVDGIVHPDRTPRPGYYDMKKAYEPFEITLDGDEITIRNKRFFTSTSDIDFYFESEVNGTVTDCGKLDIKAIAPRESETVRVPVPQAKEGTVTLNIYGRQNSVTPWAEKGYEIGFKQFVLCREKMPVKTEKSSPVNYTENRTDIVVTCGEKCYCFDRITGVITRITVGGKDLITEPVSINMWRAATYNTRGKIGDWSRARYDHIRQKTYSTSVTKDGENVVIKAEIAMASAAMPPALKATHTMTFAPDGTVKFSIDSKVTYNAPSLPRFSLQFVMPDSFSNTGFLGYGPFESYSDRYKAARLSLYETTAKKDYEPYVKPQESCSHYSTSYAYITDGETKAEFYASCPETFCFKAIPYDDKTIHNTLHHDELPETGRTYVNIDYKILAGNQGKEGEYPEREFGEKEFTFEFTLAIR